MTGYTQGTKVRLDATRFPRCADLVFEIASDPMPDNTVSRRGHSYYRLRVRDSSGRWTYRSGYAIDLRPVEPLTKDYSRELSDMCSGGAYDALSGHVSDADPGL